MKIGADAIVTLSKSRAGRRWGVGGLCLMGRGVKLPWPRKRATWRCALGRAFRVVVGHQLG